MYQIPVGDNMRIHLLEKYNVWQFFHFCGSAGKLGRLEVKMEGTFGASTSSSSLSARLFDWLAKSRQSIKWPKPLFETFKLRLRCCLGVWFVGWIFQGCFTMVHTAYTDGHSGCRLHPAIHRVNKSTKTQSEYISMTE
jgi:hypothetical protein